MRKSCEIKKLNIKLKKKFETCQKCGIKKRFNYKSLCTVCYNKKNMKIDPELTTEQIEDLKEEIGIFKNTLEIIQRGLIDLSDIFKIIEYHNRIYNREYIGTELEFGEQIDIMWSDLIRFYHTF